MPAYTLQCFVCEAAIRRGLCLSSTPHRLRCERCCRFEMQRDTALGERAGFGGMGQIVCSGRSGGSLPIASAICVVPLQCILALLGNRCLGDAIITLSRLGRHRRAGCYDVLSWDSPQRLVRRPTAELREG